GRRLTLIGAPGAVVDGGGRGTVLDVAADGAVVRDLAVRGSGPRVLTVDAAVRVRGRSVRLERVRIADALYGINAERATGLVVADCRLAGRVAPGDESGSGNGIHLWYTAGATVERDTVEGFLDGIYLSFTEGTHIEASVLERCGRYGLHTMYCPSGRLIANRMSHNVAGCAIMFSNHLTIERNEFSHNRGPRTYGILLRDCSDGAFVDNRLVDNTVAVFMDNSNRNLLRGNLVEDCGWGALLFSSCDGNTFVGNAFINDDYPVALDMRFTANRFDDGHAGNYWSDNAPYDLDGDGVSDVPYSPVSTFAFVSKQYPDLAILARSPAVAALTVAERVVPALRPSEAVDRFPRVSPPRVVFAARADRPADRARPAWGAAAGFAALSLAGIAGLARGRSAA
ncbi:MAG: nitrous oxide reductase family maturation protein NosD, partial [Candidatus Eisenbacteria bacterium]|nr:nitrous oxide reductase family maturation protein NosD [Candidatus Eisenbacteria bacterium]